MLNSFLMLGQSNMAGRGDLGSVPEIVNPDIFMLRDEGWVVMKEPINPDRPFSGVGPAASFADDYVKTYGGQIGLIPCADGGTCLNQWAIGGKLYNQAITRARQAQRDGRIIGILWHQGESDSCSPEDAAAYEEKFTTIMDSLMADLGLHEIPLILGELGDFVGEYLDGKCRYFPQVNTVLHRIALTRPCCAIASAAGLKSREDKIHFDAPSCREFGRRYFEKYRELLVHEGEDGKRYRQGVDRRADLFKQSGIVDRLKEISPDLGKFIVEFAFGDVHSRPGLGVKEREIAIVAALTTLGHAEVELRSHINAALNVGCTREEILELMIQMAVYAGFPAAVNGTFVAAEVFKKRDLEA